jgi:undecaprenyl-diphosphatase
VLFLAARREWLRAAALAIAGLGGTLLNNVLKLIFHRGRPEFATEFITHQSWSFPSGHAMNSLVGYGFLAYLLLESTTDRRARIAILVATTIVVGLVGFSRLYLGVHYPSDVIAGFLAGGIWLLVCITGYRFAKQGNAREGS